MAKDLDLSEFGGTPELDLSEFDQPPPKPTGTLRKIGDVGIALGQGVVGGVKSITDATGASNRVSAALDSANKSLSGFLSPQRASEIAARQQTIKDAEASGSTLNEIGANLGALAEAPASTIAQGLGSIVPTVAAAYLTRGRSPATQSATTLGIGAAQGAGAVKGSIYDAVSEQHQAAGMAPEQAKAQADAAQAYTGPNAGNIAIGGAAGAAAGRFGAESIIAKMGQPARLGFIKRTGVTAAQEGATEALQGGQERLAANMALQGEGFDVPTMQGLAGQAGLEGVVGGIIGGGIGAVSGGPQPPAIGADSPDAGAVNPPGAAPGSIVSEQGGGFAPSQEPPKPPPAPPAAPPSKAQAMGIDPAAGPLQSAAGVTVDTGADVVTQQQAVEKQKAEAAAKEKAKPGADGKKPEPEAPPPVQPVTPDPTAPITGPFTQAIHGASNVTPPPAPAVDPQGPAASQGAGTPADAPAAPGVGADQGPTGASPVPAAVPEPAQTVTPVAPPPTQESTNATQQSRPGETIDPETGEITQSGAQGAGGDSGQRPADALQPGADAKGPQPAPGQPTAPAPASTPPEGKPASTAESVAARERKDRWLKNVADAHRLAGSTGVQIGGVVNGRVNFLGNPNATKQGRALQGSVEEAINAGATPQEIVDAAKKPAAPAQPKPPAPTTPVDMGAHTAATSPHNDRPEPTQAQKEAGNAKLGHIVMSGLGLSIENPEGSTRRNKPDSPVKWETTMKDGHYGYVKGSIGMDGDHVDTFIKPGTPLDHAGTVFVIDQIDPATGKPDEHKVMIGYPNGMAARQAYQGNYQKGWKGFKAITPMAWDEFKAWVKSDGTKSPAARSEPAPVAPPPADTPVATDTTSSAVAPPAPDPAPTQAAAPSKNESVSPAAVGPSPDGTPDPAAGKWFGTKEKADQKLVSMGLAETHEVVRDGLRFAFRKKEAAAAPALNPLQQKIAESKAKKADAPKAIVKGEIGMKLEAGQIVTTSSGRQTTPFPKVDMGSNGKANNTIKRVDAWLISNALAEAQSRGDTFNERQFQAVNNLNPTQSDKDSAEEYLFGEQPKVVPSILKPLVPPAPAAQKDAEPEAVLTVDQALDAVYRIVNNPIDPRTRGYVPIDQLKFNAAVAAAKKAGVKVTTRPPGSSGTVTWTFEKPDGSTYTAYQETSGRGTWIAHPAGKAETKDKKPVTPQIPNDPAVTYGLPTFASNGTAKGPAPAAQQDAAVDEVKVFGESMRRSGLGFEMDGLDPKQWSASYQNGAELHVSMLAPKGMPTIYKAQSFVDGKPYRDGTSQSLVDFGTVIAGMRDDVQREATKRMKAAAPAPTPAPAAKDKPTPSANTIFTEDAAAAARARLKAKLGRLNSGLDPETMLDGITLAGYHIEKGARTFAAYAKAMLEDLGDGVKPYLKSWYMGVRYDPRASGFDGMSSAAEVDAADVDALQTAGDITDVEPIPNVTPYDKSDLDEPAPRKLTAENIKDLLNHNYKIVRAAPPADAPTEAAPEIVEAATPAKAEPMADQYRRLEVGARHLGQMGFNSPDTRFARSNRTGGVHMDDAEAIIAQVREALPTAPPIIALESIAQAPADLRKFIREAGAQDDFEAAYHNGKIYALPSNVGSASRLQFLLAHHEIRHHGFASMLGPRKNQVLFSIHATNANVRAAAAEQIRRGYATSKVLATEEALADMAVEDLVKLNGWDKIVAAVRQWLRGAVMRLRRAGLGRVADAIAPSEWTDKDVAYLIARAEGVSRGGSAKYASEGTVFGQDGDMPAFYSALTREINANTARAQPALGWASTIQGLVKAGKIKRDEVDWSGVLDWLRLQGGKVTREQLVQFLDANGVRVEETVLGGRVPQSAKDAMKEWLNGPGNAPDYAEFVDQLDESADAETISTFEAVGMPGELLQPVYDSINGGATKYGGGNLVLPGGTNYREVLLMLPTGGPSQVEALSDAELRALILRNDGNADVDDVARADLLAMVGNMDMTSTDIAKLTGKNTAQFKSGHWDQPNVLAHIRVNDRVDADGKRVLFVEEIQSDWGQAGKKQGFRKPEQTPWSVFVSKGYGVVDQGGYWQVLDYNGDPVSEGATKDEAIQDLIDRDAEESPGGPAMNEAGVPRAPFVTKTDAWLSLALKRVIKMAVDEGYDRVAFVNGDQSAARYDLSKQVKRISWIDDRIRGGRIVTIKPEGGKDIDLRVADDGTVGGINFTDGAGGDFGGKKLSDVIGKDLADKVLATKSGNLSGNGLKVGGEGMKAFYDKIVPSVAKDVLRKLGGGQIEAVQIAQTGEAADSWRKNWPDQSLKTLEQPGFTITPAMRSKVAGGLPLFSRTGDQTSTPAFKKWFGGSKVVNPNGSPMVVYHGTRGDFSTFRDDKGRGLSALQRLARSLGIGENSGDFFFAADPEFASGYAGLGGKMTGGNIMPVYLSIKSPAYYEQGVSSGSLGAAMEKAKRDGRDGIIVRKWDEAGAPVSDVYIAFDARQIKSTIGNNGDFNPTNSDIRFARGGLDSVTDKINTTTKSAGNTAAHYRGLGLQALGRRQITELYGDILPQLGSYNTLMAQMDADKNEAGAQADQIAQDWGKLKDERQLAELMHDATLAQMDPEKPLMRGDDPLTYEPLRERYAALSPEAKKVYADARDAYRTHHENVRKALRDRIERSELRGQRKAELLKQMDDEFYQSVKGVYFPLARFGDYVVIVRNMTGKAVSVNRAETINEAEALQVELRKAYPEMTVGKVLKSKEFNAGRDAVGRGFMQNLYEALGKADMDDKQRGDLEDMLGQLYLSALPDLSWAKHGIHRKGTPGFSQDARRAFAQNTFHGARYLAKVRYSDLLENELSDAQKQVNGMNESESFDSVKAQQVIDEMVKRHDAAMNPDGNALSTALTSIGFVFHLGLSPASAVVNLTQTALVAYPIMGAKWGFDKAAAALLKASQQAAANRNDISAALSPEEKLAYNEAVRSGVIDVTMAHDLAGISQGEDAKVSWKLRPVMRWASFLFHHAEKFNRQATFVAAYRLAREAGSDTVQAYEQASKATYDGHFDYSAANRPRIMQGNAAKVILLFKQYGQNMVYTLARQAYLSMKGKNQFERAQARKALGGLLTMHAAAAGVLGLPMVSTLLAAASMLGGDDDEPWDAEVALRNMLAEALGDQAADVLARGLSRLTPWDISGRVGLDKLILPDIQEGLEGQRLGESAMAAALGPVAGIGVALLKGMQEISDGNFARGLEAMAPSLLRGPARAVRYASEGAIDKTGKPIVEDVGAFGIAGQALGFSPSEVRLATEAKSAVHQADAKLAKRRATLMRHYAMAVIAGDEEGAADAREDILAFNEKNPGRRINPLQMARSVATRKKQIAESQGGVYLPKTRRDAMEAGQFGMP